MTVIVDHDSSHRAEHWATFYSGAEIPQYPSQFAVFTCNHLTRDHVVVEFGCGSGRDALFFARHGFDVLGFDAAEDAIVRCRQNASAHGVRNAEFNVAALRAGADDDELSEIADVVLRRASGPIALYARFFLHAITSDEEDVFLRLAGLLLKNDDICAVEFRTVSDQFLAKETPPHYRRYIEPDAFAAKLKARGFKVVYFVQGLGYADYKSDNAHVARFVFQRVGRA